MCDHCGLFNYLDLFTFGGPTGDYELTAPMASCKYMEFRLYSIANSPSGDAKVIIGTKGPPKALPYDTTVTLTKDAFFQGVPIYLVSSSTFLGQGDVWARVTHSQRKIFARIDAAGSGAAYIAVQFRARLIDIIPGPTPATHPDLGDQMNIERSERIEKRLKELGMPAERLVSNG